MHVANLQLEGLLMAVASINNVLVRKGLLSVQEIDDALAKAESGLMADEHVAGDMSASNRDAVCFPIRCLSSLPISANRRMRSKASPSSPAKSAG